MKKNLFRYCLLILISIFSLNLEAQTIYDFKVKNTSNEKDRTAMLDILRASMYKHEDESHDCCYVSALFVKKAGKWYIEDSCIFPTDACSYGIGWRHPQAPIAIFDEMGRRRIRNN